MRWYYRDLMWQQITEDQRTSGGDDIRWEARRDAVRQVAITPDPGRGLYRVGDVRFITIFPLVVYDIAFTQYRYAQVKLCGIVIARI